jgi:NAD-dependent dihydropyrimidine dehydrogenase PreA subunit
MAYVIAEPCIDVLDVSCVSVCPVDCIHFDEGTDRKLFIDPNECIDCGACEPECPVEAIFPEDALPDKWEPFVAINYAYDKGAEVIDPLVQKYADDNDVQNPPLE